MANALYQALKALDPHTFQLLVVHLLKAHYPAADIKQIDGSAGDQGLDVISGQLDEHPTIWQCKSFSNGIKDSQKQQIKRSLDEALRHFTPERWILCLSVDMDAAALRWFQKLTKSFSAGTQIGLFQASDIIQQLLYQHTICETFFPTVVLNTAIVRESLVGTKAFTTEELAALNEQNINSYLARLEAHNARFIYRASFTRDRQPTTGASPGALLSMIKGSTVLEVFPRDPDALKANPPSSTFSVRGTGVGKFLELHRTGDLQQFDAEEFVFVASDFDFLMPDERAGMKLTVIPRVSQETMPFRIIFGVGESAVTYGYVSFKRTRAGSEETLLESVTSLPFPISLLLSADGTGNVSFAGRCKGHTVKDAQRQARAIMIAIATGSIDFYDLAKDVPFLRAALATAVPEWLKPYCEFLDDAAAVVDAYNVNLVIPAALTQKDSQALGFLYVLLTGVVVTGSEMTVNLVKCPDANLDMLSALEGCCALRFTVPEFPDEITLFGTSIRTGPVQFDIAKARVLDPLSVCQFLKHAPVGAMMAVAFEAIGPVTVRKLDGPSEYRFSIKAVGSE